MLQCMPLHLYHAEQLAVSLNLNEEQTRGGLFSQEDGSRHGKGDNLWVLNR